MINLVDLYYNINKDIFFTDKISSDAFTIYTNNQISDIMWNYAAISNLSSLRKNYDEICHIFQSLNRQPSFYLREDQRNDICELVSRQILIKYPESWLRFDGGDVEALHQVTFVQSAQEKEDLIRLFKSLNTDYYKNMPDFINLFEKTFSASNFYHFIAYHKQQAVSCAILGMYNGYALITHLQTLPEFQNKGYTSSVLHACVQQFLLLGGKELYIQVLNSDSQEKWCMKKGFKKMFNGYLLR